MKNIFNVYVEMQDQAQCDRMKHLCVDNKFKIEDQHDGFLFNPMIYFYFSLNKFQVWWTEPSGLIEATETEFIELLKKYKNE